MALSIPVPMPGIGDRAKLELTSVGLVRWTKKAKKLDAAMQQPLQQDPGFPFEAPSGFRFEKKDVSSHWTTRFPILRFRYEEDSNSKDRLVPAALKWKNKAKHTSPESVTFFGCQSKVIFLWKHIRSAQIRMPLLMICYLRKEAKTACECIAPMHPPQDEL